jgi:anti-sigma B factor antagonist
MEIKDEKVNSFTVVGLSGKLDASNAGMLESKLLSILDKNETNILVDFQSLDYISSSGLRVLLFTAKKIKELKGRFLLCSLAPHIKEVFEIAGFTAIFKIFATRDEAISAE